MLDRNEDREIYINDHDFYTSKAYERGINFFKHYGRTKLNSMSKENIKNLNVVDVLWKSSDRLYRYAYKYYGDARYWSVIGLFNKKPIDIFYNTGDIVHIPLPLEEVLYYYTRDE